MNLNDFLGLGGFPIVIAVTQLFKRTFTTAPIWATVLCALAAAEAWGVGVAWAVRADILTAALIGIIVWLMAMGVWSGTKGVVLGMRRVK